MDNAKNDAYYLERLKADMAFIVRHMKDATREELCRNELLLDSMLFRLIQISENAKKLSDTYTSAHLDVPGLAVSGLRNRIVHDYGSVDLSIVYATLKDDIPELLTLLSDSE